VGAPVLSITVFGLGEAGSAVAADLVAAGTVVTGYDPADVPTPGGVRRAEDPIDAVVGADLVLGVTSADDAMTALSQAIDAIPPGALYADLATASPNRKRQLEATAREHGLAFADVALMSIVAGRGLSAPAIASGSGAERYVALLAPLGAHVEAVGQRAGDAATRKLLRSVVIKGLAGALIESMRAANAAGLTDETWENLVGQFTDVGDEFLRRLVTGTGPHAVRRLHEMEAARELLESLGVFPHITSGTIESLRGVAVDGLPDLPE
jgi:3-hydroxyisobutyrate dehydrogenase-like beta-hydroxyacid dehydrogenase